MLWTSIRGRKPFKSSRSGAGRSRECGGGEKGRRRKGGRALPAGLVGPNTAETCYSYCTYCTYHTYSTAEIYSTAETYSTVRGSWAPRRASPTPCTPATALTVLLIINCCCLFETMKYEPSPPCGAFKPHLGKTSLAKARYGGSCCFLQHV